VTKIRIDPTIQAEASDVLVRYASGIDRRDWALFRTCFTPDCVVDYGEIGVWNGVDEITSFMVETHARCGHTLHRITNIALESGEDGLLARSYVDAMIMGPDNRAGVRAVGYYEDELVHSKRAGWQISRRTFTTVYVTRVDEG
jgi:SnoaL-like domain